MQNNRVISETCRNLLPYFMIGRGVGPAAYLVIFDLYRKLGHLEPGVAAAHLHEKGLENAARAIESVDSWGSLEDLAGKQVDEAASADARIICELDSEYPELLRQTGTDSPGFLFVRGQLAPAGARSVAVIGTRKPTDHGRVIAQRLTQYLTSQGASIVSGLALGCDAIAHKTALDTGAHTVAVLAHGLQTIAPKENHELAERIVESGGALVSPFPFGMFPTQTSYATRDKYQAGMSQAVVMIQSTLKGGSLYASLRALHYGRRLIVPYPTAQDLASNEESVAANLTLASKDAETIINTLKQAGRQIVQKDIREGVRNILVLKSRSDYPKIFSTDSDAAQPREQADLF